MKTLAAPIMSSKRRLQMQQALEDWYRQNARTLPWRSDPTPYKIWISEIMAQQTRLGTVEPYFNRFIERFGSVADLARASLDEVLTLWSGLGYYQRARNLHSCAQKVVQSMGEIFPKDLAQLRQLPGIGPYTAAAIASIAMGQEVAVLDGNVIRVLCRLFDLDWDTSRPISRNALQRLAQSLIQGAHPGDFNQAMMELGALVCTPGSASCGDCALRRFCLALRHETVLARPVMGKRTIPQSVKVSAVVVRSSRGSSWLLVQNPYQGLFGGLWMLPQQPFRLEASAPSRRPGIQEVARGIGSHLGTPVKISQELGLVRHELTHRRLEVHLFLGVVQKKRLSLREYLDYRWIDRSRAPGGELALSVLTKKLLRLAGIMK